jgi:hypothetical protein
MTLIGCNKIELITAMLIVVTANEFQCLGPGISYIFACSALPALPGRATLLESCLALLYFICFTKKAPAFFKISFSIRNCLLSRRNRYNFENFTQSAVKLK